MGRLTDCFPNFILRVSAAPSSRRAMPVKIKICGITKAADAAAAVEAGAHAVGFMFFEGSRRNISHEAAREIIRDLPPFVSKVGVFVNAARDDVKRAIDQTGIDTLQFHGEEPPEACRGFGLKTVKAFRVQGKDMLALMPSRGIERVELALRAPITHSSACSPKDVVAA